MIEDGSGGTGWAAIRWRVLFAAVAAVSLLLGIVGFCWYLPSQPDTGRTPADIVYYSLQLFVLGPDPLSKGGPLNVPLEIARFGAPAATVFTVFEALRLLLIDRWRRWTTARCMNHVVVCGEGPASVLLACNVRDTGQEVVLVGSAVNEVARRHGLRVVTGDPRDLSTLRAAAVPRASAIFASARASATNVAVAFGAQQLARGSLAAYAQVRDDELVDALRARQTTSGGTIRFTLGFFALDDVAARILLDQEPAPDTGEESHIVIFGLSSFGRALLRAIGRRHDPAAGRTTITVVTSQPEDVESFSKQLGLAARNLHVTGYAELPEEQDTKPGVLRRTYVCVEDEDIALNIALHRARTQLNPVVLCLPQKSTFEEAITSMSGQPPGTSGDQYAPLHLFGILDAACQPALLSNDFLGLLARAIHERYRRACIAQGDTPATNSSLVPWAALPRHLKESNYAQAEHINVKLAAIDCAIGPATPGADRFTYRNAEIEQLARMEHQRWMDERLAAGFHYGRVRDGNHHPDLVAWDQLSPESREKDLDVVRHLPELLAETGLRILRQR
jgi:TrkA-N domain